MIATEPIPLGTFELTEGPHTLSVEIVGANDKAVKSYMFGIAPHAAKPYLLRDSAFAGRKNSRWLTEVSNVPADAAE